MREGEEGKGERRKKGESEGEGREGGRRETDKEEVEI